MALIVILAEYLVASRVVATIGFGPAVLLVLYFGVVGVLVIRWKIAGFVVTTLEALSGSPAQAPATVTARALGLAAGLLIALPGFVTSAIGLALLFSPVRRAVQPFVLSRITAWSGPIVNRSGPRRGPHHDGTIIDVDVVGHDTPDASPSARPEIG